MKNLHLSRFPTSEELYALEHTARRLRSEEMARLIRAAANAANTWVVSLMRTKVVRHA